METLITGRTGQEVYPRVIEHVLTHGRLRSPRGRTTLDAGFTSIQLAQPYDALPMCCGRALNPRIAAAEAVQLVGGFSRPDLLTLASGNFKQFMNGDGFHGAYGSRIKHQVPCAVDRLTEDPSTRRAVITLWDPYLDNLPDMRDYPCTVMIQFEFNQPGGGTDELCMNVVMRSNDVWLGLPYDMFQFAQLQLSVCNALKVQPGWYRHTALSLHMYADDVLAAEQRIHRADTSPFQPLGFGRPGDDFPEIMRRARRTTTDVVNEEETEDEAWYRKWFASYLGRDVDERRADDREEVAVQS